MSFHLPSTTLAFAIAWCSPSFPFVYCSAFCSLSSPRMHSLSAFLHQDASLLAGGIHFTTKELNCCILHTAAACTQHPLPFKRCTNATPQILHAPVTLNGCSPAMDSVNVCIFRLNWGRALPCVAPLAFLALLPASPPTNYLLRPSTGPYSWTHMQLLQTLRSECVGYRRASWILLSCWHLFGISAPCWYLIDISFAPCWHILLHISGECWMSCHWMCLIYALFCLPVISPTCPDCQRERKLAHIYWSVRPEENSLWPRRSTNSAVSTRLKRCWGS